MGALIDAPDTTALDVAVVEVAVVTSGGTSGGVIGLEDDGGVRINIVLKKYMKNMCAQYVNGSNKNVDFDHAGSMMQTA